LKGHEKECSSETLDSVHNHCPLVHFTLPRLVQRLDSISSKEKNI
jgi:hypothetical protein